MTFAVINVLKNSKEMIKMVKIQHTCDICEKIADTNRITTPILVMDQNGLGIIMQELDICQDCIMKVCPVQYDGGKFSVRNDMSQTAQEPTESSEAEPQVEDFDINNLKKGK